MNPFQAPGRLTSGRRTYQGNRLVGGVANSHHLDGSAGDYVGTTPDALRAFFGSGAQIIPEKDHLHVQGLPPGTFPYFGRQGTAGMTQGQAPQMAAPRKKPATLADLNQQAPISLEASPMQPQAASLADLTQQQGDIPAPHHSKFNLGNIAGILGDALMAYGGMQPQFGPNLARQQDEERQMGFDREKLNAQLQMEREKALRPPNNDTANDYTFWQSHLSPEEFEKWKQSKIDPPQYMNIPGVGLVQIPRSNSPATPTAPVGKLTPL